MDYYLVKLQAIKSGIFSTAYHKVEEGTYFSTVTQLALEMKPSECPLRLCYVQQISQEEYEQEQEH